ncbi:MAG TPA: MFS transporter [Tepidisphaeraceae bacterium]|nr:MFS transporter [Tepidisphaeraceae bacterium]
MSSPPATPETAPPKGALLIIFLIVLLDLLGFGIIIPLLPLYAKAYHATPLEIGVLFSVYSVCQFVASPPLGALSDKHGRRGVLVYSQFGSVIGYVILGLVMQVHWTSAALALELFYLSRVIDGISGGNISTAQAYIADVTTAENRARGMGVIGAAFGIGFAVGPALGGLLAAWHPALPGYFAAAASFTAMLMTYRRLPESRVHRPTESAAWLHPNRFLPVLKNRRLSQLLLIGFISMAGFAMMESMMALFLARPDTFNWHPLKVGLYYGYIGLVIAMVQGGLIGRLTRRFGDWPFAILGPLLVSIGMANLVYVGFHPILFLLMAGGLINATGRSLQTPTLYALISKNADARSQGVAFGLNQGLSSLARATGPAIAGAVYAYHPTSPFALAAIISILAALWTGVLRANSTPRPQVTAART